MMREAWRLPLLLSGAALLVVALYVGLSAAGAGPGFPLDDGWIHQTYARNLARTGRWEYMPGVVSAGSTAPIWTVWLTVGHLLGIPIFWWAFGSGALCLAWLATAAAGLWRSLWPARAPAARWAGLAIIFTWPLIWAAGSGMETLLFAALGVQLLASFFSWSTLTGRRALLLGAGSGLLILVRPDGLVLLLLLGAAVLLGPGPELRFRRALLFGAGTLLPLLPYFLFNFWASGQWWPNTLYAKQAEYGALLAEPLVLRFARLLYFSVGGPAEGWRGMSGVHLLLLPGLLVAGWQAVRRAGAERRLAYTVPLLWAGGHILLYAWRLPVTYQHGRYLLPALPIWVLYGVAGWEPLLTLLQTRLGLLWRRAAILSFAVLAAIFLLLGAQAYVRDVAFIEAEMVATAHWINDNTEPEARIASHDIGAIGYFTQRPLIDLAGLVTPDLVPYLSDEAALADYLQRQGADYLVTAPGWPYEEIVARQNAILRFSTEYPWTREQGLNNMAVYRLP
jgi:hypothetical protein